MPSARDTNTESAHYQPKDYKQRRNEYLSREDTGRNQRASL